MISTPVLATPVFLHHINSILYIWEDFCTLCTNYSELLWQKLRLVMYVTSKYFFILNIFGKHCHCFLRPHGRDFPLLPSMTENTGILTQTAMQYFINRQNVRIIVFHCLRPCVKMYFCYWCSHRK